LLGEALGLKDTLLARPRVALVAEANNMNNEPQSSVVQLCRKINGDLPQVSSPSVTTTITPGLLR